MWILLEDGKKMPLAQLIPESWLKLNASVEFRIVAYYIKVSCETTLPSYQKLDFLNSRIIIFRGKIRYLDDPQDISFVGCQPTLEMNKVSESDNIVVCITKEGSETGIFEEMPVSILGLLSIYLGVTLCFKKIFFTLNSVEFLSEQTNYSSPHTILALPNRYNPILLKHTLNKIYKLEGKVNSLEKSLKQKVFLSFNWFTKSLTEPPLNSFLMMWFAIEAIVTKKKGQPIAEAIANTFNRPKEAQKKYALNKLPRLRNNIVHEGVVYNFDWYFILFVRALFLDIANNTIHFRERLFLEEFQSDYPFFEINSYLIKLANKSDVSS